MASGFARQFVWLGGVHSTAMDIECGRDHTLSGMMLLLTGRLPKVADTIQWQDWRFEIVDMDGKTVDKVLASRLSDESTNALAAA